MFSVAYFTYGATSPPGKSKARYLIVKPPERQEKTFQRAVFSLCSSGFPELVLSALICGSIAVDLALQVLQRAEVALPQPQPDPHPCEKEKRHQPDMRVVDEARRDRAGQLDDGTRALLEKIVDEIAIARLGAEEPQDALPQQEQARDFHQCAGDRDEQYVGWHGAGF